MALLLTDDTSLTAIRKKGGDQIIHEKANQNESKIGVKITVSHTTFPKAFVDKDGIVHYDSPGFADSRKKTPHIEIANAVFVKNVVEHAGRLKVLVAANHFSVNGIADRTDFSETLSYLKHLFNNTSFKGCVGMVVTEVESSPLTDEEILEYIAEFLKEVKENLEVTSAPHELAKRQEIFDEFLKTDSDGSLSRIAIFRRLTSEGPLATNNAIQKNKQAIKKMIQSLKLASHKERDVGYVLSNHARLLTTEVHRQLIYKTVEMLKRWSKQSESYL